MKHLAVMLLAGSILTSSVIADEKSDKAAFKEAYAAYQDALKDGKNYDAIMYAKKAYEYGEKVFGPDHKNTAALLFNYGHILRQREEAKDVLEDALSRYENIYGEDAPELLDLLLSLAANSTTFGSLGPARSHYNRALKIAEKHYPDNAAVEGQIRLEMGQIALQHAQAREAMRHLERARALFETIEGDSGKLKVAEADFFIGKYLMAKNDFKKAENSLLNSLEVFEAIAPNSQTTMTNHAFLIRVYEELGQSDMATEHCRAIGARSPSKPDEDYLPVYQISPVYPHEARTARKEGYAIVELTVDKDGFVKDTEVIESKGDASFKKAAIEAVQKFRYAPRYENGQPVDTEGVTYRFTFNIAD